MSLLKGQGMIFNFLSLVFPTGVITIVPCLSNGCYFVPFPDDRSILSFLSKLRLPSRSWRSLKRRSGWRSLRSRRSANDFCPFVEYPLPRHFSRWFSFSQGGICQKQHDLKLICFPRNLLSLLPLNIRKPWFAFKIMLSIISILANLRFL